MSKRTDEQYVEIVSPKFLSCIDNLPRRQAGGFKPNGSGLARLSTNVRKSSNLIKMRNFKKRNRFFFENFIDI